MKNGNFTSEQNLQNYVSTNFIDQLVLFGLDNNIVVGNPSLEATLRTFLTDMRTMFPGIQLGAAASSDRFLKDTDPFLLTPVVHAFCEDGPQGMSVSDIENLMNYPSSVKAKQEAEMLKSVCRLASFSGESKLPEPNGWEIPESCFQGFDFLFIEIEYWSTSQFGTVDLKNEAYNNLKNCLYLGQKLKCKFNCLRNIDAEFNPRDIPGNANYQPLSRSAQIKECDFLMDQVMLVNYVTPDRAGISFDYKCDVLHAFADSRTKKHSQIIIANSAEKIGFVDCHGVSNSTSFLGAYLDGTDPIYNGNMYSVEQDFVSLMENPNYVCPNCACTTYLDNHFTNVSLDANEIIGSIWFASSFMMNNNLTRHSNISTSKNEVSVKCYPNPSGEYSKISMLNGKISILEIIDLSGRQVLTKEVDGAELTIDNAGFQNGVYQIRLNDSNNNLHQIKYIVLK